MLPVIDLFFRKVYVFFIVESRGAFRGNAAAVGCLVSDATPRSDAVWSGAALLDAG